MTVSTTCHAGNSHRMLVRAESEEEAKDIALAYYVEKYSDHCYPITVTAKLLTITGKTPHNISCHVFDGTWTKCDCGANELN